MVQKNYLGFEHDYKELIQFSQTRLADTVVTGIKVAAACAGALLGAVSLVSPGVGLAIAGLVADGIYNGVTIASDRDMTPGEIALLAISEIGFVGDIASAAKLAKLKNVKSVTNVQKILEKIPPGISKTAAEGIAKYGDDITTISKKYGKDVAEEAKRLLAEIDKAYPLPAHELKLAGETSCVKSSDFIKNKFPNEPIPNDGKIINYTLNDGKIKDIEGLRRMDFVIDKNGKLIIGKKHQTLGNAEDVSAAGQLKVDGDGMIRRIDNNSGHYRPTVDEATKYPELFEKTGFNLDNAWLDVNKYTIDDNGIIVKSENVIHRKIK